MTELLVLGLDGMPPRLYDEYVRPHMDYDIEVSTCESSIPPATTPATHHLQTGYDGSHDSVYGYFSRALPGDQGMPSGRAEGGAPLDKPTFFEALDHEGIKTLVSWMPNTYPAGAYELDDSVLIGGLQGSNHGDRQLSTYPEKFAEQIGADFGATMQEPGPLYANEPHRAWRQAKDRIDARMESTLWAADLGFECVLFYSFPHDQLNHWHLPTADHPVLEPDVDLYTKANKYLASVYNRLIDELDPNHIAVFSDHGFRDTYGRKAFINARLMNEGFLVPGDETDGALTPDRDHVHTGVNLSESVAICRKDKIWVQDGHLDDVRASIRSWEDPMYGENVVDRLIEPDWQGEYANVGPDLVVRPGHDGPGYDFLYPGTVEELTISDSVGAHSSDAMIGGAIDADRIHDIPHAICDHFGVSLADTTVEYDRGPVTSVYDNTAMEQRLEDLGYL